MPYGQKYDTSDLDDALSNVVTWFDSLLDQSYKYDGINAIPGDDNAQRWRNAYYIHRTGTIELMRGGWDSSWSADEKAEVFEVMQFANQQRTSFTHNTNNGGELGTRIYTNPHGLGIKYPEWDLPFARDSFNAPRDVIYEPQPFYIQGLQEKLVRNLWIPYDINTGSFVGQPIPNAPCTSHFLAESSSDNEVFLFYDTFKYFSKEKRDDITETSYENATGAAGTDNINSDWNIEHNSNIQLKEGFSFSVPMNSSHTDLSGYNDIDENHRESRMDFVVRSHLSGESITESYYINRKPYTWEDNKGGDVEVVLCRDFEKDNYEINKPDGAGESFVFASFNPNVFQGTAGSVKALCRNYKAEKYNIEDFSLKVFPYGWTFGTPVPHHPTAFLGVAAFQNNFQKNVAYYREGDEKLFRDGECGASFPLDPSFENFQLDNLYSELVENKIDRNYQYVEDGYVDSESASKADYTGEVFSSSSTNEKGFSSDLSNTSVILKYGEGYTPTSSKTSEEGEWKTAYNYNFSFYNDDALNPQLLLYDSAHTFFKDYDKDGQGLTQNFTFPTNYAPKFGNVKLGKANFINGHHFENVEPINFKKPIKGYSKDQSLLSDSSNIKKLGLSHVNAATRYNHNEFFKRNDNFNFTPSSIEDIYHISTTNTVTGQTEIRNYWGESPYFSDFQNYPWGAFEEEHISNQYFINSLASSVYLAREQIAFCKRFRNFNNICYYGFNRQLGNYDSDFYNKQVGIGGFIKANKTINAIFLKGTAFAVNPPNTIFSNTHNYITYHDTIIPPFSRAYFNASPYQESADIIWQNQIYTPKFSEPVRDSSDYLDQISEPIFRMGSFDFYRPMDPPALLNGDTSKSFHPHLGIFGGGEILFEILNCASPDHKNGQRQNLFYHQVGSHPTVAQTTNTKRTSMSYEDSDISLATTPVMRWGLEPDRYSELSARLSWFSSMPLASRGQVEIKDSSFWDSSLSQAWSASPSDRNRPVVNVLQTREGQFAKLYGTIATCKHLSINQGKAFGHPDVCYSYDAERGLREYEDGEKISNFFGSDSINYRIEFSDLKRARELSSTDISELEGSKTELINTTEFQELFYDFSEGRGITVGVKRRYNLLRPVQFDFRDFTDDNFNYFTSTKGITENFANPNSQNPLPIEPQVTSIPTRKPYEIYENLHIPKANFGDKFRFHEALSWWSLDKENINRAIGGNVAAAIPRPDEFS